MLKLFTSLANDMKKNLGKTILTLFTVALGVGILTIALSLSGWLKGIVTDRLEKDGLVLNYANAEWTESGDMERIFPPALTKDIVSVLKSDLEGVEAVAPIFNGFWSEISTDTGKFQIRNVLGTSEEYREVMKQDLLEGNFFTGKDVETGAKKAVISESLAIELFGSAGEAINRQFQPPSARFRRRGGEESTIVETFVITGVFSDPNELLRESYQIGDMILPITALLPGGSNASRMTDMIYGTGMIRIKGYSLEKAESLLRQAVAGQYGEDTALIVWEGAPNGDTSSITEARKTVATFNIVVNILGLVLLFTGTIGILSIMMIEALGRTREIALERALGASRRRITGEFLGRSLMLSAMSILLGIVLALLLLKPFAGLLGPVFTELGLSEISPSLSLPALLTTSLAALLSGGILGIIPVITLMQGSISETVREG